LIIVSTQFFKRLSGRLSGAPLLGRPLKFLCTPGMGVNLWGASPLYVNPVNVFILWHKY